jgi:nucleotide-binding universal stress UspA family protein
MSYKTILVHVDHSPHGEARVRAAAALALAHEAHLTGAAMVGLARIALDDSGADLGLALIASQMAHLRGHAEGALARFDASARAAGVPTYEARLVDDDAENGLALQARYADLVVISQWDPEDACSRLAPGLAAHVMKAGGRPLLVLPHHGKLAPLGKQVLLAWDASVEATRAVAAALPLLKRALAVRVAIFNPGPEHGAEPGADLAVYLARHGVRVQLLGPQEAADVGDALLSLAADTGSDLLVMGGYGHTVFREMVLGGITRTVLRSMTVPVLMAH